jgi:hypothetical protein
MNKHLLKAELRSFASENLDHSENVDHENMDHQVVHLVNSHLFSGVRSKFWSDKICFEVSILCYTR